MKSAAHQRPGHQRLGHQRLGAYGAVAALGLMGGTGLLQRCGDPAPAAPVAAEAPAPDDCVALTNNERANAGLAPVSANAALDYAARFHAQFQARRNTMTHTGSGGSDPGRRIANEGYSASTWGENVAYGYNSCSEVMVGWMNSPGHRENILNPAFTEIGMGSAVARNGAVYWTMDLAAP
jgi:uncharacterized protein YkwD